MVAYLDRMDDDRFSEALADDIRDPPEGSPYNE